MKTYNISRCLILHTKSIWCRTRWKVKKVQDETEFDYGIRWNGMEWGETI